MGFQDILKLYNERDSPENKCKGKIYRFFISSFLSSYNTIEVKKSLRPLKRESCPGCEKCGWIDEFLCNEILDDPNTDYLGQMEHKKKYMLKLTWIPGPYEYPDEGEIEIDFVEIEE